MGLSTAALSSCCVQAESFGTRSWSSTLSTLSTISVSRQFVTLWRALGQSDSSAPEQRISAEDNPFVKPLSNVYSVVPCRMCQGSNWTAMERTFGRHHYYVHSKRRGPRKDWFLEMVSACDETTRFWINSKILKDREQWSAGWLQRGELHGIKDETLREEAKATICKACKGCRTQPCQMCAKSEGDLHQSRELDIIDV
ncbi:hypothetical protein M758_1G157200 [Ceratodon purpureus]|uniref:Uncharacterized protein n=1 Tax=Ceratodon purpureus TaxID=3225 RepID=A0A8T0J926_CERPU|nr:hypothetical protein KC19_1G161300 [Ceratodon purpureus]KAG0630144.1 hypothetical protein M758_1G157200 [Ceratodon purpureus]